MRDEESCSAASTPSAAIDSSNVGFKLLKKCGWKEGTGLGASEQGMLEPIPTLVKKNKRGIGADNGKKKVNVRKEPDVEDLQPKGKKQKKVSKRIKKMQQEEERMKEREFERAFFREFWPDNV